MPENPNPCNLKLTILFVEEDDSCCVWSHNLSAEDADQELEFLQNGGLFALTVAQRSRHKAENPDDCTLCRAELACICPQDVPRRSAGNALTRKISGDQPSCHSTNL